MKIKDIVAESKLDEISHRSLDDYRRQAHYSIQGHKFGSKKDNPDAAAVIAKREKGMQRAGEKQIAMRQQDNERRAQAARDQDSAQIGELKAQLAALEKQFDPQYQYSDDYSFWSKQNQIAGQINSLKKRIAATGLEESRMSELDIEYQDYKKLPPVAFLSRYGITKDAWFAKYKNIFARQ